MLITKEIPVPIVEVGMFLGQDDVQKVTNVLKKGPSGYLEEYYGRKRFFVNVPGDELLSQGHGPHTDLVQKEAAGEDAKMSLILAHVEDQMMSTEVFKVLAEEMIELYKKVNK